MAVTQKAFENTVPVQDDTTALKQRFPVRGAVTYELVTAPVISLQGPVPVLPDCHWMFPVKLDKVNVVDLPTHTIAGIAEPVPTAGGASPVLIVTAPLAVQQP